MSAVRWDPIGASGGLTVARVTQIVRGFGLFAVIVSVLLGPPRPGVAGRGLVIALLLGVCVIAWLAWMWSGERQRPLLVSLTVLGLAGGALAGVSPRSGAVVVSCVVALTAGAQLSSDLSLGIVVGTASVFLLTALVAGMQIGFLIGYPIAYAGIWAVGLTRRAHIQRAVQAEDALEQTRRANAAEARTAALAERARIAREIHDVLAHSLAAVSVNLQAAEGLLGELPADDPRLAQAIDCVTRAGMLTREGLADTRRAVLALRHDAAPLAEQLAALAEEYRAAGDLAVEVVVAGPPRPIGAEAALAAYRTAQEALTNARKHAPGGAVEVLLGFEAGELVVRVTNPLPAADVPRPLTATGSGAGLAGLRERAVLAGGTLEAGPIDGEWRVCLRIAT